MTTIDIYNPIPRNPKPQLPDKPRLPPPLPLNNARKLTPEELAAKLERERLQAESNRLINEKRAELDREIALKKADADLQTSKELALKQLEYQSINDTQQQKYQSQAQTQQLQYEAQAEAESKIFGLDLTTILMLGGAGVAVLMVMKK